MTKEQKLKAIAELDGCEMPPTWYCGKCRCVVAPIDVTNDERHDEHHGGCGNELHADYKPYLTSYDAILPVIRKWCKTNGWASLMLEIMSIDDSEVSGNDYLNWSFSKVLSLFELTPKQLSDALIKASGEWVE